MLCSKVSRDYRLVPEKSSSREHLYLGYKESEYPCDELDREILNQVRNKFQKATTQTSLIMFNVDKENNGRWLRGYKKQTLHITIVYSSTPDSLAGVNVSQNKVEILSHPLMREHHRSLNSDICIATDKPEKYRRLCSLLEHTYTLFSGACNTSN